MRRVIVLSLAALLASASLPQAASAADKIRVVATIPDLKALAEEVGGKLVDVEALARGNQNAHELEVRPSLMLKLRRADVERNRQAFLSRLDEAMAKWTRTMEPLKGAKVVVYHPQWIYLLTRFGLSQAATLEDRPGIPASPAQVTRVIRQMKDEKIKVLIVEPWNDLKLADRVADEAGAKAVVLASMVGGVKGTDTYIAAIDHNVNALAQALR